MKTILAQLDTAITELEATGKYQDAKELHEVFRKVAALGDFNPGQYFQEGLKNGISGGATGMMMSGTPAPGVISGLMGVGYAAAQDVYYHTMSVGKKIKAKARELKHHLDELMMNLEHIEPNLAVNIHQTANQIFHASELHAQQEFQKAKDLQAKQQPVIPDSPIPAFNPGKEISPLQYANLATVPSSYQPGTFNQTNQPIKAAIELEMTRYAQNNMMNKMQNIGGHLKGLVPDAFREKAGENIKTFTKNLGNELVHIEPNKLLTNLGIGFAADKLVDKIFEKMYHKYVSVKTQAQYALKEIPKIVNQLSSLTVSNPAIQQLLASLQQTLGQIHAAIQSFNPQAKAKNVAVQEEAKEKAQGYVTQPPKDYMPVNPINFNTMHANAADKMCRIACAEAFNEFIEEQENTGNEHDAATLHHVFVRMSNQGFFTAR